MKSKSIQSIPAADASVISGNCVAGLNRPKAEHTPGPWHRNIRCGGKYPVVFSGRNQHVATACQQSNPAETEANIDLISAAPDLLAALQALSASLDRDSNAACDFAKKEVLRLCPEIQGYLRQARAVVAKATGGSL